MKNPILLLVSVLTIGISFGVMSQTARVLKQRLDSTINFHTNTQEPLSKRTFQYDQLGYPSVSIRSYWDTLINAWEKESKYQTMYDPFGNQTLSSSYRWSSSENDWIGQDKNIYTYTSNHLVNSSLSYTFGFSNKQWTKFSQVDFLYNQDSTLSEHLYSKWNENTNTLEGKIKYLYYYNNNGVLTQKETYRWDGSLSIWDLQSVYTYEYNSQDQKTKEESVAYLIGTPNWIGDFRKIFSYNSLGGLLEITEYSGLNQLNVWYQNKKTQYLNDTNNNHLETITSEYDTAQNVWNLSGKIESQYNSNDQETLNISYARVNNSWLEQRKYEYSFDSLNQLTSETWWNFERLLNTWIGRAKSEKSYSALGVVDTLRNYRWDLTSQSWFLSNAEYTTIDAYNNPINQKFMVYDTATTIWTPTKLITKDFNTNFPKSDLIIPYSYRENFQLDSTLFYEWNTITDTWNTEAIRVNYFSTYNLTSTTEIHQNEIFVYPNPVQNQFSISGIPTGSNAQLTLYDATGRLVLSTSITSNRSINSSLLNQGMYIYVITNLSRIFTGKIIKN